MYIVNLIFGILIGLILYQIIDFIFLNGRRSKWEHEMTDLILTLNKYVQNKENINSPKIEETAEHVSYVIGKLTGRDMNIIEQTINFINNRGMYGPG
jgi:hypothetical protein